MAREVYANPFGSYVDGYEKGAQREQSLQRDVRSARDSDYKFYNMDPIALETAQRANAYGAYADPYMRKMLPIGVDAARANLFTTQFNAAAPLSYLGVTTPAMDAVSQYTGQPYVGSVDQGFQPTDQFGNPQGPLITPQGFNEVYPAMREEATKRAQAEWDRTYKVNDQAIDAQNAATYGLQGQAKAGQGVGLGYGAGTALSSNIWGAPIAPPTTPTAAPATAQNPFEADIEVMAQAYGRSPQEIVMALQTKAQQYNLPIEQVIQMYIPRPPTSTQGPYVGTIK